MTTNVLILCTHNSARSVLAEAMLNHHAARLGRDVRAYSAGSAPSGRVNPLALAVLADAGVATAGELSTNANEIATMGLRSKSANEVATTGLRSKSWDEFAAPSAPRMRIVITVCDSAAGEACPLWPGDPVKVHWGYPDPSNAPGEEAARKRAFELTRQAIGYRMLQLLELPLEALDDASLRAALLRIAAS
jgi:arsenate reductase